jgi:hypothetical protein
MKEEPTDHVVIGFKVPQDGWHQAKFQQGIDYLPAGKGKDGFYQNEKGFKTLKLPCLVDDDQDPDNEAQINVLVNTENGHKVMAGILLCVGLWEAVNKRFPGKDVTVFDQPVIEGIKVKLPGMSCMMRTEIDKNNNAAPREIVTFAKYKEIQTAAKTKAADTKKGGGKGAATTEPAPEVEAPKEW